MPPSLTRTLAIDWGQKRCGLAWTDPLGLSTNPLDFVPPQLLLPTLQRLVVEGPVGTIVLGYPTRPDGTDTHSTEAVRALAAQLQTTFPGVQLVLQDERFTSREAKSLLIQGGIGRQQRREKGRVDTLSAVLLLQAYLESSR
jgi:putative holliday junction resolvase